MAHILVVDDDPACLMALAQRLRFAFRRQRLEVDVASSASEALMLAHTSHYEALIVDLIMPGVTRFKFVEQLAHIQPGVPVIVMSGFEVDRCEEEVHRRGLTAFLPKPLDFSILCHGLAALLPERPPHPGPRAEWLARRGKRRPTLAATDLPTSRRARP